MGEKARFRKSLAGTFGFNDFISQGDNEATIVDLLRTMVPTVDMRDFQRRYQFDSNSVQLFLGDRISRLTWTVPANEFWRPLTLFFTNGDSITHTYTLLFTMDRNPAIVTYTPVKTTIVPGGKIIYGADVDGSMQGGISAADEWISRIPVIMEPGDLFELVDATTQASTGTARWIFVYERVPQPAVARNPGVVGQVTVVP